MLICAIKPDYLEHDFSAASLKRIEFMVLQPVQTATQPEVFYPDTDDQPMAENTVQYHWLVMIKENISCLFIDDPNVFVAGDLFWYPVEGDNKTVYAPDVMVVFGRPKGDGAECPPKANACLTCNGEKITSPHR